MKHAEDTGGASAPSTTGTPVTGGASPGRTAMAAPRASVVAPAAPPPRPLGGGGGMPSSTRSLPKLGSLAAAAAAVDADLMARWMGGMFRGIQAKDQT